MDLTSRPKPNPASQSTHTHTSVKLPTFHLFSSLSRKINIFPLSLPRQKRRLSSRKPSNRLRSSLPGMAAYDRSSSSSLPFHLCFFLLLLVFFISFSWLANMDSIFEGLFDNIKLTLIFSPLIFLLVLHLFSIFESTRRPSFLWPEADFAGSGNSTPWGVGFCLVLVLFMISYHSAFRERWFPLLSRS